MHLLIASRSDVEQARREARALALTVGLELHQSEAVVLAVSELATNLLRYAHQGEIRLAAVAGPWGPGIQVESHDRGPGIPDIARAMQDGFSTGGGLGSGLPGVQRLMDDFEIASSYQGTRIVTHKWKQRPN